MFWQEYIHICLLRSMFKCTIIEIANHRTFICIILFLLSFTSSTTLTANLILSTYYPLNGLAKIRGQDALLSNPAPHLL